MPFISCGSCGCASKSTEERCPHCGAVLRSSDGSIPRTAAAVVLGLAASIAGCGDDTGTGGGGEGGFAAEYGVPGSGGMVVEGGSNQGGATEGGAAEGGAGGGGAGEGGFAADYGVPGTGGFDGK